MVKVAISGVLGRMGRAISNIAYEDKEIELVAGIESPDCAHSHDTIGEVLNKPDLKAPITPDLAKVIDNLMFLLILQTQQKQFYLILDFLHLIKTKKLWL